MEGDAVLRGIDEPRLGLADLLADGLLDCVDGADEGRVARAADGQRPVPRKPRSFQLDRIALGLPEGAAGHADAAWIDLLEQGPAQIDRSARSRQHHRVRLLVEGVGRHRSLGAGLVRMGRLDDEVVVAQAPQNEVSAAGRARGQAAAFEYLAHMQRKAAVPALHQRQRGDVGHVPGAAHHEDVRRLGERAEIGLRTDLRHDMRGRIDILDGERSAGLEQAHPAFFHRLAHRPPVELGAQHGDLPVEPELLHHPAEKHEQMVHLPVAARPAGRPDDERHARIRARLHHQAQVAQDHRIAHERLAGAEIVGPRIAGARVAGDQIHAGLHRIP